MCVCVHDYSLDGLCSKGQLKKLKVLAQMCANRKSTAMRLLAVRGHRFSGEHWRALPWRGGASSNRFVSQRFDFRTIGRHLCTIKYTLTNDGTDVWVRPQHVYLFHFAGVRLCENMVACAQVSVNIRLLLVSVEGEFGNVSSFLLGIYNSPG